MARPIQKRTAESYQRDIEAIGRLRTAILMDTSLDQKLGKSAVSSLDDSVEKLRAIIKWQEENSE